MPDHPGFMLHVAHDSSTLFCTGESYHMQDEGAALDDPGRGQAPAPASRKDVRPLHPCCPGHCLAVRQICHGGCYASPGCPARQPEDMLGSLLKLQCPLARETHAEMRSRVCLMHEVHPQPSRPALERVKHTSPAAPGPSTGHA